MRDDRVGAHLSAHLHWLNFHFVVGAHDGHLEAALKFRDGGLRNEQRVLAHFRRGPHSPVLTGPQNVAAIRKSRRDADRPRAGIDLPVGPQHFALVWINAAVGEQQRERHSIERSAWRSFPAAEIF